MSDLIIRPNLSRQTARVRGNVSAGEHITVTIEGCADLMEEGLRFRVVDSADSMAEYNDEERDEPVCFHSYYVNRRINDCRNEYRYHKTLALCNEFTVDENDLTFELNLNTKEIISAMRGCRSRNFVLILDNPDLHKHYFTELNEFYGWMREKGTDEPIELDSYPSEIEKLFKRMIAVESAIKTSMNKLKGIAFNKNCTIGELVDYIEKLWNCHNGTTVIDSDPVVVDPEPEEPTEPTEPTEPVDPEPEEPTEPTEPTEPVDPEPKEPTEPTEPDEPLIPEMPENEQFEGLPVGDNQISTKWMKITLGGDIEVPEGRVFDTEREYYLKSEEVYGVIENTNGMAFAGRMYRYPVEALNPIGIITSIGDSGLSENKCYVVNEDSTQYFASATEVTFESCDYEPAYEDGSIFLLELSADNVNVSIPKGTSGDKNIAIGEDSQVRIDWGDGESSVATLTKFNNDWMVTTPSHTYASMGRYYVNISNDLLTLTAPKGTNAKVNTLRFGDAVTSSEKMFWQNTLTDDLECEIPGTVTNVRNMFEEAKGVKKMPKIPSGATSLYYFFNNCKSLTDISELANCSQVTNLNYAFTNCTGITNVPSLPAVLKNAYYAFYNTSIPATPDLPSTLTNAEYMFGNCKSLVDISSLATWVIGDDVLINASHMFENCTAITALPTMPSIVKFTGTYISDRPKFDNAFKGCTSLTNISSIEYWNIKNAFNMFQGCTALVEAPNLPSTLTEAMYMFNGCTNLECIGDLPSTLTDGKYMFDGCVKLNVEDLVLPDDLSMADYMFRNCTTLSCAVPTLPSNLRTMEYMFYGCSHLTGDIPLFPITTTNASYAYYNCSSISGTVSEDPFMLMPNHLIYASNMVTGCSAYIRGLYKQYYGGTLAN